jgi:hypothetical protein
MKTTAKLLFVLVALAATVPAVSAPPPNLKPVYFEIVDYAPRFIPRTWAELIRWLSRR